MKGRGEIIAILCMSVFLICILYAMTYGGIVKAEELEKQPEKAGEKTEVDIEEELRWAEEVKKILKDIGVGFCDELEDKQEEAFDQTDEKKIQSIGVYALAREGDTVYTKKIERGIGAIDVVDYNDPNWPVLQHWNEGRLGTQSGESLYCTNPTLKFQEGNKTAVDASKRYNKQTIQMIAAMFYYYDENKCNGVSSNYDYLLKQCAVWWIMNEVHHWYGDMIQIETGNSVACGNGHWISTHKLKEVKAPDGYRTNNNELIFRVDESGKTEFLSEVNTEEGEVIIEYTEDGIAVVTIEDKPACYKIELKKENEKGVALAGAEFTLYEDQACQKEIDRVLTDGNGIAMFENLEVKKKYYMKETKAPTGYRIPKTSDDADIEYEICLESNPEEGKCLLVVNGKEYRSKDTADSRISIEGSIKEWNVKMKIINQTGKKLPNTGSAGKPVLLTGILAVGIMAMIYRKKEQKR